MGAGSDRIRPGGVVLTDNDGDQTHSMSHQLSSLTIDVRSMYHLNWVIGIARMPSCGLNCRSGKRELLGELIQPFIDVCCTCPQRTTVRTRVCVRNFLLSLASQQRRGRGWRSRAITGNHGGNSIMRLTFLLAASFIALAVALPCLTIGSAGASSTIEPSILAASCSNCHGTDGRSPGSIPSIADTPYSVLKAKLEAFKANPAPDDTVMPRLMRAYDAEQIEQLARYFSTMKPRARP